VDIDKQLGRVFADSLLEVVSVTAGFYYEVLSEERDNEFSELTGVMHLRGKKMGMLFVSANEDAMKILCSCMMGVSQNEVTREDIEDALCEVMNMTAGNAKLRLGNSEYVYELTSPVLLRGESMSVATKRRTHFISRTIGNSEMSIKIKVIY
jgi:CheY-specific phosphatase CheX